VCYRFSRRQKLVAEKNCTLFAWYTSGIYRFAGLWHRLKFACMSVWQCSCNVAIRPRCAGFLLALSHLLSYINYSSCRRRPWNSGRLVGCWRRQGRWPHWVVSSGAVVGLCWANHVDGVGIIDFWGRGQHNHTTTCCRATPRHSISMIYTAVIGFFWLPITSSQIAFHGIAVEMIR